MKQHRNEGIMEEQKKTRGRKKTTLAETVKDTVAKVENAVEEAGAPVEKAVRRGRKKAADKVEAVVKKTTGAKPGPKKGSKRNIDAVMNIQFSGKSYTMQDFVAIVKDVWKYDLKQKASDLKSVELYVKPEENQAYYVINGEHTGSFLI